MPNWCFNYVKISGKRDKVLEFGKALFDATPNVVYVERLMQKKCKEKGYDYETIDQRKDYYDFFKECYGEALQEVKTNVKALKDEDKRPSFNTIVPMPIQYNVDLQNVKIPPQFKDGRSDDAGWYDWHCRFWGTKWDMCEVDGEMIKEQLNEIEKENAEEECSFEFLFDTAWSFPEPFFMAATQKFPEVKITCQAEEESSAFFLEEVFQNGYSTMLFEDSSRINWLIYREGKNLDFILEEITRGWDPSILDDCIEYNEFDFSENDLTEVKNAFGVTINDILKVLKENYHYEQMEEQKKKNFDLIMSYIK